MSDSVQALFHRYQANYRWIATATVTAGRVDINLSSTVVEVAIPNVMGMFARVRQGAAAQIVLPTSMIAMAIAPALLLACILHETGSTEVEIGSTSGNSVALHRVVAKAQFAPVRAEAPASVSAETMDLGPPFSIGAQ